MVHVLKRNILHDSLMWCQKPSMLWLQHLLCVYVGCVFSTSCHFLLFSALSLLPTLKYRDTATLNSSGTWHNNEWVYVCTRLVYGRGLKEVQCQESSGLGERFMRKLQEAAKPEAKRSARLQQAPFKKRKEKRWNTHFHTEVFGSTRLYCWCFCILVVCDLQVHIHRRIWNPAPDFLHNQ